MFMARWINNLTIRWKLVLITILTCAIAELLAAALIVTYSSQRYDAQKVQQVSIQSEVLASSLTAPLIFNDESAAQEYLDALKADREIVAAGAYDSSGKLLAKYVRSDASSRILPDKAPSRGQYFGEAKLMVSLPVTQAGAVVGNIYLVTDTDPLMTRLLRVGGLTLLATIGSLLIAVPVSLRLNSGIAKPIREIAEAASSVTSGDFNIHLTPTKRTDEIGVLVSSFGQMIESLRDLMRQERLRALGQMSSGIAHDINNAMSPIALYTDSLLESEEELDPHIRSYLEIVKRVVDDVRATVGRMRDFSRKREAELTLTPVNINELIQHAIDLTRARWCDMPQQRGLVVNMQADLMQGLPAIMGVEGEIREALTNLIFNAVDAMPEGGTISIRTRVKDVSPTARYVRLEVADTGIGMDEDTRRRCFEPFFTTKGEQGTGLGMAMVYGVVQRHSAEIEIASTPGKGTTVALTFLSRASSSVSTDSGTQQSVASSSQLRILIVDDDPHVLDSMRVVLGRDGHWVTAVGGGQEGIDSFCAARANGTPYSVVITDLGMPHVDGKRVAHAVKEASPLTPVILLTGWGQQMSTEGSTPADVDHILGKPPELAQLRNVLAQYS